jgi:hypothetical protein
MYEQTLLMAGYLALSGSSEGQMVLVEDEGKVFVAKAWHWSATDVRFDVKFWRDAANNSWIRGKTATDLVNGENLVGQTGTSVSGLLFQPIPLPIVIYGTTQHTIDMIDRSGSTNYVRLVMLGEELTAIAFKKKYPDQAAALGV